MYETTVAENIKSFLEYTLKKERKSKPESRPEMFEYQRRVKLVRFIKKRIEELLEEDYN